MVGPTTVSPNREEMAWECSRVEVYVCSECHNPTRFPRYNNPRKVLETRKGRCGEYTTGFIALANAMGFDTRYVQDFFDHVWAEVYIPELERWVHADPSEGVLDSPLIYATGWGKQPCVIIAGSKQYGVADVTARYSPNYIDALMARRKQKINGFELYNAILTNNALFARPLSLKAFQERRDKELAELAGFVLTPRTSGSCSGRTSGSYEWRKSRGELGASQSRIDFSAHQLKTVFSLKSLESNQILSRVSLNGCCELVGKATENHQIRLTPNSPDQTGSVFLKSLVNLSKGFRICFRFMVGKGNGADGFALVFQASGSNAIGEGGCGLGYSGIENSVALEFDTYRSEDRCADPDDNHLSLQVGKLREDKSYGNVSSHHSHSLAWTSSHHLPPFQTGTWCGVMVKYLSNTLQVDLDDSAETGSSNNFNESKMCTVLNCPNFNLVELTNKHAELYVGFTASTGGLHQEHWIEEES